MELNRHNFSKSVKTKRVIEEKKDMRTASKEIGISAATLSRIERGKIPDVNTFFLCCKWLGVSMDSFFGEYYFLKHGEIIQPGDECEISAKWNDDPKWVPAGNTVGLAAPDPAYISHRKYRRFVPFTNNSQ